MSATLVFRCEFGIFSCLVYLFTVQVGEPGLDVAPRDKDSDVVVGCARRNTQRPASLVQLLVPFLNFEPIAVDHCYKGAASLAHGIKLLGVRFPNKLVSCAARRLRHRIRL